MEFDLATLPPEGRYRLLTGLIVPRPIAFVSSLSTDGVLNAAPFSFFNMFGASPAVVVLGINLRGSTPKDSYNNIQALGEFVINIATFAIARQLNLASGDYGPEIDEFDVTGLTATPSVVVKPPRIAESPANLECRLMQTVPLGGGRALIVGEMVHAHVRDDLLDGLKVDQLKLDAIGRMGGPTYSTTRDTFDLARPVV